MLRRIVVLALAATFLLTTVPIASAVDTPASQARARARSKKHTKYKKYNKKKKGSKAHWGR